MSRSLATRLAFAVGLLATLSNGAIAFAAATSHAIVPGFERIAADPASNALAGGLTLVGELGCIQCHQPSEPWKPRLPVKAAPNLERVGARVRVDYLRKFIADPQATSPGTTMPSLFAHLPPEAAASKVNALVHYLASTGVTNASPPVRKAAVEGKATFNTAGCVACHGPLGTDAATPADAKSLLAVGAKYSPVSLEAFLLDPLKVRPSGRMPSLNLRQEEARNLAHFLIGDGAPSDADKRSPNLKYSVFKGHFDKTTELAKATPSESGAVTGLELGVAGVSSDFGMRFEGFFQVPKAGEYTFHLGSDDGSRMLIDGKIVIDSGDGTHGFQWAEGKLKLEAGPHPLVIEYFQGGGEAQLEAEFNTPDSPRQPLEANVTLERTKSAKAPSDGKTFVLDPTLAAQGAEIFASVGCASCHQMKHGDKNVASTLQAKPLGMLKSGAGCMSPQAAAGNSRPSSGNPQFALSDRQRATLAVALTATAQEPPATLTPRDDIHRTMMAMNCYACHSRDGLGGVEPDRNEFFKTTQPEMGDEGRVPPPLTGVGDKLREEYIRHIFDAGGEDRPYMVTRMPKFGLTNLEKLAKSLHEVDAKDSPPPPQFARDRISRVKADGRMLVGAPEPPGTPALSCINCHDYGKLPSKGIRSMNLSRMNQRLRHEWFGRYLLNPQTYRPGTRMPAAWPDGKVFFPKVLDGDAAKQIEAIWLYLSDGDKSPPRGLGGTQIELVADKEAVIYRNFIEGAGPRAIGVGYPEKANLAFDAENLRLALVWHGRFIDASRHWSGRGEGFQAPLGDHVVSLVNATPLAVLADPVATAWPKEPAKQQGYQFLGYHLDQYRRPTFMYRFQDLKIHDAPTPVAAEGDKRDPSFKRTLVIEGPAPHDNLYFLAARGSKIEAVGDGFFTVGGDYRVRVSQNDPASKPIVRQNETELLLPLHFHDNRAEIVEEIIW